MKSVSPEGDGKRKGLLIGDCLLSVNGPITVVAGHSFSSFSETSLFNKSRHNAVDLVSACEREVRLELLRFPSISEVLSHPSSSSTLG